MAAKCAGQPDPVDVIGSHVLHQEFDAGIQGGLRELDGPHVVLGDLQGHRALMNDIAESPAGWHDAVAARGQLSIHDAILVDDAAQIHLGNHFDDSRAADAGDPDRGDGLRRSRAHPTRDPSR